jgi:hypothetical protein
VPPKCRTGSFVRTNSPDHSPRKREGIRTRIGHEGRDNNACQRLPMDASEYLSVARSSLLESGSLCEQGICKTDSHCSTPATSTHSGVFIKERLGCSWNPLFEVARSVAPLPLPDVGNRRPKGPAVSRQGNQSSDLWVPRMSIQPHGQGGWIRKPLGWLSQYKGLLAGST